MIHVTEVSSGLWILEAEPPALVRVGGRRARRIAHTRKRARSQTQEHGRIDLLNGPQMNAAGSEITCRRQPVCADLLLNIEVPLSDLHVRRVVVLCCDQRVKRPRHVASYTLSVWLGE